MLSCLRHRPGRSNILGQIPTISALPGSSLLFWLPQLCHINPYHLTSMARPFHEFLATEVPAEVCRGLCEMLQAARIPIHPRLKETGLMC